jgi:hypothetical protein
MVYSRAATTSASLSIFIVTVRVLIERGVMSKDEAAEVLDDAAAMLARYGGEASTETAMELLSETRAAIGIT